MEVLKRIEPTVVELTKEEYENHMGIKPEGGEGQKAEDVKQPMGEDSAQEAKASVPRGEAIKALRAKGYEYKDLKKKTAGELNALL